MIASAFIALCFLVTVVIVALTARDRDGTEPPAGASMVTRHIDSAPGSAQPRWTMGADRNMAPLMVPPSELTGRHPAVAWPHTRLVHSLPQHGSIVLDCLLGADLHGDTSLTGIPFTLLAHSGVGLTPWHVAEPVLRQWADRDALVDIFLRGDGYRTLLSIRGNEVGITLELERIR
jgi:hypothetical protein